MMKCRYETPCSKRCLGTKEIDPCIGYDKCKAFKPNCTTNADRIRSMSDEELAEIIAYGIPCVLKAPHCKDTDCKPCILKWLQQPAEERE